MKKIYRVKMLDNLNYIDYMNGGMWSAAATITNEVEAANAEEAEAKIKEEFPNYHVFSHSESKEEYEERIKQAKEDREKEEIKKAERKAKAKAREEAKAKEAGLSIEQYKARKNNERKIRETEKNIIELEEALIKAKSRLEYLKNKEV